MVPEKNQGKRASQKLLIPHLTCQPKCLELLKKWYRSMRRKHHAWSGICNNLPSKNDCKTIKNLLPQLRVLTSPGKGNIVDLTGIQCWFLLELDLTWPDLSLDPQDFQAQITQHLPTKHLSFSLYCLKKSKFYPHEWTHLKDGFFPTGSPSFKFLKIGLVKSLRNQV